MEVNELKRSYADLRRALFCEGFLDKQYKELEELQDESCPEFVSEIVNSFFEESEKSLHQLSTILREQPVNFNLKTVANCVHKIHSSSISIGAQRVSNVCLEFSHLVEYDQDGCIKCLRQLKNEHLLVKDKLQTLLKLEQQILAAGESVPSTTL